MSNAEKLSSRDILDAFDRFRRDGNYSDRLTIDRDVIETIVTSWSDDAERSGILDDIGRASDLMHRIANIKPISTPAGELGSVDTSVTSLN